MMNYRNEDKASKHINLLTHYDGDTLLDKNDRLIKIIKLQGINFVTQDDAMLDIYKNRRNSLFKSLSSEFALYFWEVRSKVAHYPAGVFKEGYARELNQRYVHKINQTRMFQTELYLAIITKQPEGLFNKLFNWLSYFNHAIDKAARTAYLARRHKELNEVTQKLMSALSDYQCELLGVYEKNNIKFSAPLEFVGRLINFDQHTVPLEITDAAAVLPRKRLFFNHRTGSIEARGADGSKKFAAVLSIKAYSPFTHQGILDELGLLKIEYVITQSYRPFDRHITKTKLRDQQKEMMQSKEESITQTDQIDEAFDEAATGEAAYGLHHFTLVCYAESQDELNKNIAKLLSKFSDIDIIAVREDRASECGFWAQLPANFSYALRDAVISSKNMAAFASLHNHPRGKLTGNHWGPPVTVFQTLSGSPYYFNFHYKDVGNFLVFGATGSGKTVLVGFLMAQSMKFGGKRIIFDKDRGLEILVHAAKGTYEILKPGIPTGFNPCQLDDTPENRKFLSCLFKKLLTVNGEFLSAEELEVIERAILGMYRRLDKSDRQFCHIASFFGVKKPGSLRARFDQWHSGGPHAWLFDNATDTLNLDADVLGFDLGSILSDKECKTPALMYLLHRVEQALVGGRGIIFFDEGWLALNDEYFKAIFNNWARILRKKNIILGLATQVANDTVHSSISKAINESAFCKIFFPNPLADRKVYVEELGLSEENYRLIKKLPDDQHYFLLEHGLGANKESVVLSLNLEGLDDDIAVISANENTLALFDQIRHEASNDPEMILPKFHERRRGVMV